MVINMLLIVIIFIFEIFKYVKMLNFAYYQMALVNVGQKGKVSTRKVYIDTLRSSLFYRG